jgi:diaminopimelate epimerase
MNIHFWKMHGAGNDFILVDDRTGTFPVSDTRWLSGIGARRTGVGCEGIILIQNSDKADFRMRFFNPDGNEVDMCGNGARCVARLAHETGVAPAVMSIETAAGMLKAEMVDDIVKIELTEPRNWETEGSLEINGRQIKYGFVNTGVPHAVIEVDDLASCNVRELGAAIRYHTHFAPAGTNADFIHVTGTNSLSLRTYERGVEDETLACGTGIAASALIAYRLGKVRPPVEVKAASGDILIVGFRVNGDSVSNVTLAGPAVHVFQGDLRY